MKKLTLILAVVLFASSVNAQKNDESELKPFKVDLSVGYAIPGGSGSKGGVLFVVEPKYSIMPQLALGLRIEAAVVARVGGFDASGNAQEAEVKAAASYLATGDYYFSSNYSFRPFAGAGVGLFQLAGATSNSSTDAAGTSSKFGGMVRAGIEAGHFRFGLEYNIVPSSDLKNDFNNTTTKIKNGYIGIKLGVCLGGGPR